MSRRLSPSRRSPRSRAPALPSWSPTGDPLHVIHANESALSLFGAADCDALTRRLFDLGLPGGRALADLARRLQPGAPARLERVSFSGGAFAGAVTLLCRRTATGDPAPRPRGARPARRAHRRSAPRRNPSRRRSLRDQALRLRAPRLRALQFRGQIRALRSRLPCSRRLRRRPPKRSSPPRSPRFARGWKGAFPASRQPVFCGGPTRIMSSWT